MSAKDSKKTEQMKDVKVWVRTPPTGNGTDATLPATFLDDPSDHGWTDLGEQKEPPSISQPLTTQTADYADRGFKVNISEYDSVKLTLTIGQFDEDTEDILFTGAGDTDLAETDVLVQWSFLRGKASRQFAFGDAVPSNFGDYSPNKGDGASMTVEYTIDPSVRMDGKSYLHSKKA